MGCDNRHNNEEPQTKYAVVIGIADYQNVADLEFSDKDAQALGFVQLLADGKVYCGFAGSAAGPSVNVKPPASFFSSLPARTRERDCAASPT